ncbi:hypothetical protein EVAR_8914_1 [Eumeta japonica]|uniref:MADF domain-containing protein n=1 Tax=Eumeta variegata TaxID=151549 RepID=A0A4C1U127_EUMVA|nr:hypothetical protein EVAR_8914_1 [Eumeta japonica]
MMVHRSGPPYRGRSGVGWLVVRTMVAEWPRYRFFRPHIKGSGPAMAVPIYTSAITQFALKCGGEQTCRVSDAWNRISNNMGIPVDDLKKKKETLMTAFRTNLKKKKESMRSGAGFDDIYTPSWPFFDVMESFLKDVYECKSIINTDGGASTSLDDEDSSMSQNGNLENENPNATVNSEINIPVVRRRSRNPPELQEASNEMKGPFHL